MYHRACDNGNKDNWLWSEFRKWPHVVLNELLGIFKTLVQPQRVRWWKRRQHCTRHDLLWSEFPEVTGHVLLSVLLCMFENGYYFWQLKGTRCWKQRRHWTLSWFTVHCVSGGDWTCSSKRSAGNLKHRYTATGLGVLQTSTESELLAGTV